MSQTLPATSVTVLLDGRELIEADARALVEVVVHQRLSQPAQCELVLVGAPRKLRGRGDPGAPLVVRVGDDEIFRGELTAVAQRFGRNGSHELRLRGYDALHRLRKVAPLRVHVQTSTAELATALAQPLGIDVKVAEDGPLWPYLLQHGQSDLELLAEVVRASGLAFTLVGNTLQLSTAAGDGEPVPLELGTTLFECAADANSDPACGVVHAVGLDWLRGEDLASRADQARRAGATRTEVAPAAFALEGLRSLTNLSGAGEALVQARAQAALDAAAGRELVCSGIAVGQAALRPGARIELRGVAPDLDGIVALTAVTHRVTAALGYGSEWTTAPLPPLRAAVPLLLTIGTISGLDDPEHLGRVQVTLPALGGLASPWLQVVLPGAGKGKGLIALPDVGDRVLVLWTDPTFAQGVVLGGLYGTLGLPDGAPKDGRTQRFVWLTSGGQKIALDDARRSLRLEQAGGSYIELTPKHLRVHAASDLTIEAPGRRVVIAAEQIDFQRT